MSTYDALSRYHGPRLALAALLLVLSALAVLITVPFVVTAIGGDRLAVRLNESARRVQTGPQPTCLRRETPRGTR